jgi:hypothetical protein
MCLAKHIMHIIKKFWTLFLELRMRASYYFLFIVAPLRLNKNKISKALYITNISEKNTKIRLFHL